MARAPARVALARVTGHRPKPESGLPGGYGFIGTRSRPRRSRALHAVGGARSPVSSGSRARTSGVRVALPFCPCAPGACGSSTELAFSGGRDTRDVPVPHVTFPCHTRCRAPSASGTRRAGRACGRGEDAARRTRRGRRPRGRAWLCATGCPQPRGHHRPGWPPALAASRARGRLVCGAGVSLGTRGGRGPCTVLSVWWPRAPRVDSRFFPWCAGCLWI